MLSIDEFLSSLYKLKPLLWPLLVGLSSAVVFYFQASRYSRLKPPESEDLTSSAKRSQLTVSMYANEVLVSFLILLQMVLRENDFSVIDENLPTFLSICSKTKAFLIVKVPDESAFDAVLSSLESCGAFRSGLSKHRVMFCQYPSGRVSMVQQLQPHLHVELDAQAVDFVSSRLIRQNVTTLENMESMLLDHADKPAA